jgi:alkaline phosphatase D
MALSTRRQVLQRTKENYMRSKHDLKTRVASPVVLGYLLTLVAFCSSAFAQDPASLAVVTPAAQAPAKSVANIEGLVRRICFGSCANQNKPQPILRDVVSRQPDLFIYLGDNIYGDTEDMSVLRAKYEKLGTKPEFQALRAAVPTLAIWDDHDYGANDSGKEYRPAAESRDIFLDFWREPQDSSRRQHPGIYHAHRFSDGKRTLQVILLDTRSFRDPLAHNKLRSWKNDYHPDPNPNKTFLGDEQWKWLAEQLRQPADVRIIASSIQFSHQHNGWESWTNLPQELLKMTDVIKEANANGVVFISGDVHWGELSKLPVPDLYPLYDVTSSGLTETWPTVDENQNRVGEVVRENNFGMIEIDWNAEDPEVHLQLIDVTGKQRVSHRVRLSELQPKKSNP